ncbi:MAG TPA: cytochrome c biogenesis protein CcsA [Candidatus Krumholzibacteria bacterium]|nr:cytochrome c biogenesis protein CcsA [Candidatus Krumholzibacteria bacterium]
MVTVQGFFKNPVVAFLTSLKLSAVLMSLFAIAIGYATFFESSWGRDGAYAVIYGARWFEILLALLTINMTLLFFKRWPYEPRQTGFVLVHIAIVVILVSAGITRYFGYEGIMPIREGQTTDFIYSDKSHVQAQIGDELASFPVRPYRMGMKPIFKKVQLGGRSYDLGMTEYWPFFEEKLMEGPGGPAAFAYGVREMGNLVQKTMMQGESANIGEVDARFVDGDFGGAMTSAKLGEIRIHIDGHHCDFPLAWPADGVHECNGWTFAVKEFQTDFKVGAPSSADGPLRNPMVKLDVTAPDGRRGEKVLFAHHPDFSMGHGGAEEEFADLDVLYQVSAGIEFAPGGATGVRARASFDLEAMDMAEGDQADIPAGTEFELRPSVLYKNDVENFKLVPIEVWGSVVMAPALSQDSNAPAAARIVIRDDQGNEASAICQKNRSPESVTLGGQRVKLEFGAVRIPVDYALHLDDFVLQTYPGSDNPATYESYVSLTDQAQGIEGRKVHIYMNHPLTHRGSKHFQSSYDPDRKGTVLSVNHDPGKWPTYFGYGLISLGFILILAKDLIWPRRKRGGAGDEGTPVSVALALAGLLMAGLAGTAHAQADDGHDHGADDGHIHAASTGFVTLSDPAREAASRLIIQDFRGRMKPLDTLSREMVMKIAKRTKFEGREPVDQYLSWSLNPSFWWDKPLISVKFPGMKDLLGVDQATTHVSLASLVDANGRYKLADAVDEAHRTPDRERSKLQRKLISFDERANLLNHTFRGASLRMFPIPGDENHTWQDIQTVTPRLDADQAERYSKAFADLAEGVRTGNNQVMMQGITETDALQHEFGAMVLPSKARMAAELQYNRGHIFSWAMLPYLGAFGVLMIVYIVNLFRNHGARLSYRNPFYTLGVLMYAVAFGMSIYAYVLRWIASGRAPLSNGHESLLFISLAVALAGLVFELVFRMGVPAALGGLLTTVILGVSMLSTFDPAIGPLVPVLVSYWLNIHVTIITSSYGFLGLSALIGALILVLYMLKKPGRDNVKDAIKTLDNINYHVMVTGLGLLSIGTLLGGVWANESWGRYWGWDAKETWSLVTILVYAVVLHFRFIPKLKSAWLSAALATAAVGSVVMTYFGVNYFLTGLHSYAQGDAAKVPSWVYVFALVVAMLIAVSGMVNNSRKWDKA